jgi:flagellar hook-basal body complex protein FliE
MFSEGLAQVNESLLANQTDLQKLATGEVQNLHQIMIRMEESRLSFQLMLQTRNRLLESYQDLMKMQI